MIFPLPSTVFERYMLGDDKPWHPMAFTIRLVFSGTLSNEAFAEALRRAVRREPMLSARIEGDVPRRVTWVAGPEGESPFCDVRPHGEPMRFPATARIDLTREAGLRVWVRHGDDRVEMRFQFHHACCDGIGAYRFLDDLLRIYDRLVRPDSDVEPSKLEPELLRRRAEFGIGRLRRLAYFPLDLFWVPLSSVLLVLCKSTELAAPSPPTPSDDELRRLPDYPAAGIDAECLARLSARAKSARVKLNDLLTTELFLALCEWQERVTAQPLRGWLRILIPINARTEAEQATPATNIVGMIPIGRQRWLIRRPRLLLGDVRRHLLIGKAIGGARIFWGCLRWFEKLYGGLDRFFTADRCTGTASLSNVGRVFADSPLMGPAGKLTAGGLTLEGVESAPPMRPRTLISLTVLHYGGILRYVMNYDRTALGPADADALLESIVGRLRRTAAEVDAGPSVY